jgi:hypothetical protein
MDRPAAASPDLLLLSYYGTEIRKQLINIDRLVLRRC